MYFVKRDFPHFLVIRIVTKPSKLITYGNNEMVVQTDSELREDLIEAAKKFNLRGTPVPA